MFKWISRIINTLLLLSLILVLYFLVVNPSLITYILDECSMELSNDAIARFGLEIAIVVYLLILIFSLLEKVFKKKKSVVIKGSNGNIEVTLKTLEEVSKNFLESKNIVKQAKVVAKRTVNGAIINASKENFKTDEMNSKLDLISKELEEYIKKMLGLNVKKINLSISKVNNQEVVEEIKSTNVEEKISSENDNIEELD